MADRPTAELIFDVGMHDGDDTAYYLAKGYSVVAVEAIPSCVPTPGSASAAKSMQAGWSSRKLRSVPGGGQAAFYVNEGQSQFSALDPKVAGRRGLSIREISVRTITPLELFQRYGLPFYLKVDIEQADSACLDALQDLDEVPAYVSVEAHALDYLCRLWCAGYRHFKIVDQLTHNGGRRISNETPLLGSLRQTIALSGDESLNAFDRLAAPSGRPVPSAKTRPEHGKTSTRSHTSGCTFTLATTAVGI